MKRIFCILPVFACAALAAVAQEGGLSRRVEVTRAYTPEVGSAQRLYFTPRLIDTVALRPEISYSIRPAAWQTAFGVKPITVARVDATFDAVEPLIYVKLGAGAPLQSVADVYVHAKRDRTTFGGYFNHYGYWYDIDNDLAYNPILYPEKKNDPAGPTQAWWSTNRLAVYGDVAAGVRTKLAAELQYDWNYYTRYGLAAPANNRGMRAGVPQALSYSSPRGEVAFGNDFTDLNRLNFRVVGGGGYFADREGNGETDFNLGLALGRIFGSNCATLDASLHGYYGQGSQLDGYKNTIFHLTPGYSLQLDKLKLTVGFDMALDNTADGTEFNFFPKASVKWDALDGYLVPFVSLDGSLTNNGMRSLALRNPYMAAGSVSTLNTSMYNLHGGVSGSVYSSFSYKVFVGATLYNSWVNFIYMYQAGNTGSFQPGAQDEVLQMTLGADLSFRMAGGFEALMDLRLHGYPSNDSADKAAGLPNMEIGLGARYTTLHDRLILSAGLDVTGTRYFYGGVIGSPALPYVDTKVNPVADLHLGADYRFGERWGAFLEARNLFNMDLYPWDHYRGAGINAMVGVKATF